VNLSRPARVALGVVMAIGLAFVYVPLFYVLLNSFNSSKTFSWPPTGFTTSWWSAAFSDTAVRDAVRTSVLVGLGATAVALVLGTMASFAVARYGFFGREIVGFVLVLPIALPGIVTGIALNSAFSVGHVPLGFLTVVVGHATFCVVVVYNNVLARLRRTGTSLEDASMDLGADTFTTFRRITFPQLRSALLAGALLAFALSFDEIVVTTFTISAGLKTLPIWVFENLFRPNAAPIVNVVAAVLILLSILPIWAAQKLSGDPAGGRL
jgi:putative spermidine/putrescine transport system permease protein